MSYSNNLVVEAHLALINGSFPLSSLKVRNELRFLISDTAKLVIEQVQQVESDAQALVRIINLFQQLKDVSCCCVILGTLLPSDRNHEFKQETIILPSERSSLVYNLAMQLEKRILDVIQQVPFNFNRLQDAIKILHQARNLAIKTIETHQA